jgi:hypothetical protein
MGMCFILCGIFFGVVFCVFAGGFGEIGASVWCFCGVDVVDWMEKMVWWWAVFEVGIFCSFLGFILGEEEGGSRAWREYRILSFVKVCRFES